MTYKALVKVWKTKELASTPGAQKQAPRHIYAENPSGKEGKGDTELVSVVVTAQTTGGLVKKVNLMLEAGMADDTELPVERDKHGDPVMGVGGTGVWPAPLTARTDRFA